MKRLLTIGQAAERLGLAVDTVRRLEAKGELRAHRTPGGHRRFHVAVLDAYRKGTGQRSRSKPGRRVSLKPKRPPVQSVDSFLDQVDGPDEWTQFDPDDPDEWVDYEPPVTRTAKPLNQCRRVRPNWAESVGEVLVAGGKPPLALIGHMT